MPKENVVLHPQFLASDCSFSPKKMVIISAFRAHPEGLSSVPVSTRMARSVLRSLALYPLLKSFQPPSWRPHWPAILNNETTRTVWRGEASPDWRKSALKRLISRAPKLISAETSAWNELALFAEVRRQRNSINHGPSGSKPQFIPPHLWKMGGDSSFCQWQSVGLAQCFSPVGGAAEVKRLFSGSLTLYSTQLNRTVWDQRWKNLPSTCYSSPLSSANQFFYTKAAPRYRKLCCLSPFSVSIFPISI